MALAVSYSGRQGVADYYLKLLDQVLAQTHDSGRRQVRGMAVHAASVARIGFGYLNPARENAQEALTIFDEIGDQRRWNEAIANMALITALQGDLREGMELRQRLRESAHRSGMQRGELWSLAGMGQIALHTGDLDIALSNFTQRKALAGVIAADDDIYTSAPYLALTYLRKADYTKAQTQAHKAYDELQKVGFTQIHDLYTYFNTLEVAIHLWKHTGTDEFKTLTANVVGLTRRYTRLYPLMSAAQANWDAVLLWMDGKYPQALRKWQQSITTAQRMGLLLDEAVAEYQWGMHLSVNDPLRAAHLVRAVELFREMGADWYLEHARAALDATQ